MSISILELSLQHAAVVAAQQSRPMQLRSIWFDGLFSYDILSALPAASLTYLGLMAVKIEDRCVQAIGQLSSLRQLKLATHDTHLGFKTRQHLTGLSQLTQLQLFNVSGSEHIQLPKQLLQLKLVYDGSRDRPCINLMHLTSLQQLQIICNEPAAGSRLPAQLQQLSVTGKFAATAAFGIAGLQYLQTLSLLGTIDSAEQLQQFAGHPELQRFELVSADFSHILGAAAAWESIPRLCSLVIMDTVAAAREFLQLVKHVTAVTNLTELQLNVGVDPADGPAEGAVENPCQHLAPLSKLQSLSIWHGRDDCYNPAASGAPHWWDKLSALTALTKLIIGGLPIVHESDALQLASKLTNLEYLSLDDNITDLDWSLAPLPAIGQLTCLQCLYLGRLSEVVAQQGLSQLTNLTRLKQLGDFRNAGEDAVRAFWARIRAQRGSE